VVPGSRLSSVCCVLTEGACEERVARRLVFHEGRVKYLCGLLVDERTVLPMPGNQRCLYLSITQGSLLVRAETKEDPPERAFLHSGLRDREERPIL
jgi:hypothetical protein